MAVKIIFSIILQLTIISFAFSQADGIWQSQNINGEVYFFEFEQEEMLYLHHLKLESLNTIISDSVRNDFDIISHKEHSLKLKQRTNDQIYELTKLNLEGNTERIDSFFLGGKNHFHFNHQNINYTYDGSFNNAELIWSTDNKNCFFQSNSRCIIFVLSNTVIVQFLGNYTLAKHKFVITSAHQDTLQGYSLLDHSSFSIVRSKKYTPPLLNDAFLGRYIMFSNEEKFNNYSEEKNTLYFGYPKLEINRQSFVSTYKQEKVTGSWNTIESNNIFSVLRIWPKERLPGFMKLYKISDHKYYFISLTCEGETNAENPKKVFLIKTNTVDKN